MCDFVNSGRMGGFSGKNINRHGFFGADAPLPLFDKNINEFLTEVPIRMFVRNGYKRSLIRNAMDGIIPKQIQWRLDKKQYSPDYQKRIIQSKGFLDQLISNKEYQFVFQEYLDKEIIQNHFNDIRPESDFSENEKIVGIRISQAIILSMSLKHLKNKGYLFDK